MDTLDIRAARALNNLGPGTQQGRLGERIRQLELNAPVPAVVVPKVIEIGNWDMDATQMVQIAHGLTWADIRVVQVGIINDFSFNIYYLPYASAADAVGATFQTQAMVIMIIRFSPGFFDSTDFDATPFNRGFITVWYTP